MMRVRGLGLKRAILGFVVAVSLLTPFQAADGAMLTFHCITCKNLGNAQIGEDQLTCEVTVYDINTVLFAFHNSGPADSAITGVYWDNGSLHELIFLIDADDGVGGHPGVDFSPMASPGNLPGRENAIPPFETTCGFTADSDPPVAPNGVDPTEWLGICYTLKPGGTFQSVLNELTDGTLRIGLHVQRFECGGSESFVNVALPEPATVALLALGAVALIRRRRA